MPFVISKLQAGIPMISVAKKIFREIAEEEKFHYDLLQFQYDSVMHTGNLLG